MVRVFVGGSGLVSCGGFFVGFGSGFRGWFCWPSRLCCSVLDLCDFYVGIFEQIIAPPPFLLYNHNMTQNQNPGTNPEGETNRPEYTNEDSLRILKRMMAPVFLLGIFVTGGLAMLICSVISIAIAVTEFDLAVHSHLDRKKSAA